MFGLFERRGAAQVVEVPEVPRTVEIGSFAHGCCAECEWQGPGRRARSLAIRDLEAHQGSGVCSPSESMTGV